MACDCEQCPACGRENAKDIADLKQAVAEALQREQQERIWHYEQADEAHRLREALEAMFCMTGAGNSGPAGDEPAEALARTALGWKPKT